MNNDVLDVALNRRSMLAGIALVGVLAPSLAAAEGGLKRSSADEPESAPADDLAEIGVTGDGGYESPVFGYQLEWTRDWDVSPTDPGSSSEADHWDILRLEWADPEDERSTLLEFNGFTFPVANLEPWLEKMTDPESLSQFYGGGEREVDVALVERDGDIMEVAWRLGPSLDADDPIAMISCYRLLDDGLMLMMDLAIMDTDLISTVTADFADGITLNGKPVLEILGLADIEEAFASLD